MTPRRKRIALGVFEMINPSNGMPTWTHPGGRGDDWDDLGYWIRLARTLDRAGFDFLFFADTYGYPTIEGSLPAEVAAHGLQFPALDAMLAIPALAMATERLGFVVTSPTTVEHPYATARRFASLDHYTRGRIGWNVVTGSSQSTTDGLFGVAASGTHDSRYDVADEFVDVCLQLWQGGWEDGAELRDRSANVYADPARLHRTEHSGNAFRVSGQFAVAPSAQRTPVLFQAGTSARGRAFAARNAEAVLIQGQTIAQAGAHVADIRAQAVRHGRRHYDVKVITGVTVTVAENSAAAREKRAELDACFAVRDAAVVFAGFTGLDLREVDPTTPLTALPPSDSGQTLVNRFVRPGEPVPTVGHVLDDFRRKAIRGFQVTGSPTEVADELTAIVTGSDVDGLMLEPTFGGQECYEEFIELVQPLLRDRGLLGESSGPTTTGASGPTTTGASGPTLRERLSGRPGGRLAPTHPGSRFSLPGPPKTEETSA